MTREPKRRKWVPIEWSNCWANGPMAPERCIVNSLSVSRGTVVKAFELLEEEGRVPVLEDQVAADLGFDRRHLHAIDEFDTGGYGITVGSVCKVAWPGLRLADLRLSADAFVQAAGLQGVLAASGRNFCPNDCDCSNLRIPFTAPPHILEQAMDRLSQTWQSLSALSLL